MLTQKKHLTSLFFLIFLLSSSELSIGQIRAGASFLKMLPGARVKSMAMAQTSELDDIHAIFANPAATGFIREWYGAAAYSKWIADVYNASIVLGGRIRNPFSNQTRVALGILYQGVPQFDSSDEAFGTTSASDILVSLSLGQKLANYLAFGFNLKYFKSTLDQYSANSIIFDGGFQVRTPLINLKNDLFKYGIFSAGISLTQLGPDLTFDKVGTPLPQTLRSGVSFYAGAHRGFQLQITGDYFKIKDEGSAVGLGAAFSFGSLVEINCGYNFHNDLMEKFSIGGTIRLDDVYLSEHTVVPGRNKALQLELASLDESEFFSRTFRGGVSYLPIGPESFKFQTPADGDTVEEAVTLNWENSRDPDLFDDINYSVLLCNNKTNLTNLINVYQKDTDQFLLALAGFDSLLIKNEILKSDSLKIGYLPGGDYYWAVIARDSDDHIRFANVDSRPIAHFYVPTPDVKIKEIKFDYSPWITTDDYHGNLQIVVENTGARSAKNFSFNLYDSTISPYQQIIEQSGTPKMSLLISQQIDELKPGNSTNINIPWHTNYLGAHLLSARCDVENSIIESNETDNDTICIFYTIPKGTFAAADTASIIDLSKITLDLPVITEVFFDPNVTVVKPEYLHKQSHDPMLSVLAERLTINYHLKITLKGFSDPNSENASVQLANSRAQAVRDTLIALGVGEDQIQILAGNILPKRKAPANPTDTKWVFEERRYVEIEGINGSENEVLFRPFRHSFDKKTLNPLIFSADIKAALPTLEARTLYSYATRNDTLIINQFSNQSNLKDDISHKFQQSEVNILLNQNTRYTFSLIDAHGRKFMTNEKSSYLIENLIYNSHRIVMPLQFAKTDPIYSFYWTLFLEQAQTLLNASDWRFKFSGHACAVGPDHINEQLSKQRVNRFDSSFRNFLKQNHSELYQQIIKRLDSPTGFGEKNPLSVELFDGEKILIGDNNNPVGRKLNRRIEIEFYNTKK